MSWLILYVFWRPLSILTMDNEIKGWLCYKLADGSFQVCILIWILLCSFYFAKHYYLFRWLRFVLGNPCQMERYSGVSASTFIVNVCLLARANWYLSLFFLVSSSPSSSCQLFMPLLADGLHNSRHALGSWATLIYWLLPTSSMLSLHLLLGLPLTRFPSLGVHSDVILAHLVLLILATCPAHCPHAPHALYCIFHPCFWSNYLIPNLVSLCDV